MKKILLSIFIALVSLIIHGQTITFDDSTRYLVRIDTSQKDNIWQIGRPQKTFFDSAYSRPNAIVTDTLNPYPIKNISVFTVIVSAKRLVAFGGKWSTCIQPLIYFDEKFDMDTLKDAGYIDVSQDGGKTWNSIYYYDTLSHDYQKRPPIINGEPAFVTGKSNGWISVTCPFDLPGMGCPTCPYIKGDTAILRFTFKSDSINTNQGGWMIDDIILSYDFCEGIDEHTRNISQLNVYPNPANTSVTLSYQLAQNENKGILRLYNTTGQLIKTNNISSANGTIEEDVSTLPGGIYYYTLSVNGMIMATNKLAIIR